MHTLRRINLLRRDFFESHIQCHQYYRENLYKELFVCAGISVAVYCSVYQVAFSYKSSMHLSALWVHIQEMNFLYAKI